MNIEEERQYTLSRNERMTEELFAEEWIPWRIEGKWFLLMQLDAPKVAVNLRKTNEGITPPTDHMNKQH